MKVLVVNDAFHRASAAGAAFSMAEAAAERGAEVHFLATVQDPDKARRFREGAVEVEEVYVRPYPVRWRAYVTLNNRPAVRALREAAARFKPEIVHFHNLHIHFSYAALKAASALGAKVALTVHDVMPFCYQKMFCHLDESLRPGDPPRYRARFFRCMRCARFRFNPWRNFYIRRALARSVDRVLPVSRPMADALQENGIAVHGVVQNGIDCRAWAPWPEGGERFRKSRGLQGKRLLFHGGRLDYLKGGLHLVRALRFVLERVPEARLVVAGQPGPFQEEMRSLAGRLGVEEGLVFSGWLDREELRAAYAAADLVVSPSLCFESFNLMNLEGMAMAKPVVSSFFGGPLEVVKDGETGFLVNPLDIKGLADAITRVFSDPDLARRLGEAGRARALAEYDLKKTGEKLFRVYENLIQGGVDSQSDLLQA